MSFSVNLSFSQSLLKDLKIKAEELEKNQSSSTQSLSEQVSALQLEKDAIQLQLEEVSCLSSFKHSIVYLIHP